MDLELRGIRRVVRRAGGNGGPHCACGFDLRLAPGHTPCAIRRPLIRTVNAARTVQGHSPPGLARGLPTTRGAKTAAPCFAI